MPEATIHLPRQALDGVRLRADTFDEAANTVEIIWTTGASVRRSSWRDGDYDEVLVTGSDNVRLGRLNAGAPFLNTHSRWDLSDVIGSIVPGSARMENGQGVATILLSRAAGCADIVQNIRDGVIANVSVGYIIHRVEKTEAADGTLPVWRVVDWEPFEISAVPVGADAGAQIRSADDPRAGSNTFPCVVVRADADPVVPAALPATPGETHMDPVAGQGAAAGAPVTETRAIPVAAPVAPAVDANAVRAEERRRIADINGVARKLRLTGEVVQRAIDEGTSVADFRALAIDAAADHQERSQPETFSANAGASERSAATVPATVAVRLEPGIMATRSLVALAATRGDKRAAADFLTHHYGSSAEPMARALNTSIGAGGGFLVPVDMAAEVIELLRPASAVMALGPNIVPMPRGNYTIPRMAGGANASYVGEGQVIPASQPSFGAVQLQAKKLAALVPISNDMMRFPTVQTDTIVRNDMVKAIAQRADLAFIRGDGSSFSPRGLRSFASAPALGGLNVLAASTTINLTTVSADLGRAELALEQANLMMSKPGWIFTPRTKTFLMNLRDGLGNLVYAAEMAQGRLRGKPFKATTQIPNSLAGTDAQGNATLDASEVYLADFDEVFIGEAYGLELDVFPGGSYVDSSGATRSGISTDETVIRAIVQHDMAMRQEVAVALLTNVRWF